MLDEAREERKEKEAQKRRMWEEAPAAEEIIEDKPRIQVKEGKTAFKPDSLNRKEAPEEPKGEIIVPEQKTPKAVIKKAGQRAKEVSVNDKPLLSKRPFFEKAVKPKDEQKSEQKSYRELTEQAIKKNAEPIIAAVLPEDMPGRPMLKKKELDSSDAEYDETKLAKEALMQGIQVKSLNKEPGRHVLKRGETSELDEKPEQTLNAEEKEERVFRHELKYYISEADYYLLRNSLNCLLKHDGNAGENGDYYIRSLYFDDYKNSALVDKLSGIENRKKYRIRIYALSDSFIRLERKNKTKDYISKDNLVLTREEYDKIVAGDIEFLIKKESQLAKDFYYEIKTKNLKPAVIVDYVREAYVHPIRNLRITFDKVVKSGRYSTSIFDQNVPLATVLPPGTVVLEVKFQKGLPDYLVGVLNTVLASQRSAISKYALCRKYEA